MGWQESNINLPAGAFLADTQFPLEAGTLLSAGLQFTRVPILTAGRGVAELYGYIALAHLDAIAFNPFIIIASGYFGGDYQIAFTGALTLFPGSKLVARVYCDQQATVRLRAYTRSD